MNTKVTTTDIAKIAYEATRAFNEQVFGDFSQKRWDGLTDDQKFETVGRVEFTIENRHAPVSAYHDRWLAARLWAGWTLAEYTDAKQKKHKRLLPWSMLPKGEQERDRLFVNICECFIESVAPERVSVQRA